MKAKFRAKPMHSNEWIYSSNLYIDYDNLKSYLDGVRVRFDTISQLTGYKDVNNRGIYEDDLCISDEVNEDFMLVVEFECGKWNLNTVQKGLKMRSFGIQSMESCINRLEVIGNIHDDRLLLTKRMVCS